MIIIVVRCAKTAALQVFFVGCPRFEGRDSGGSWQIPGKKSGSQQQKQHQRLLFRFFTKMWKIMKIWQKSRKFVRNGSRSKKIASESEKGAKKDPQRKGFGSQKETKVVKKRKKGVSKICVFSVPSRNSQNQGFLRKWEPPGGLGVPFWTIFWWKLEGHRCCFFSCFGHLFLECFWIGFCRSLAIALFLWILKNRPPDT